MTSYIKTLAMFSRDVRLYLVTAALIGFTVFGGIYAVLLNLYLLRLGYGPEFVGLLNAAGMFALAILSMPAGAIGERLGCRRAMIVGMGVAMVGYGLLPLSEMGPHSFQSAWLLSTFVLAMTGLTLYIVNSNPFLMNATTTRERSHVFSVQVALWPLAGFAGSLVGGLLPVLLASHLGLPLDSPIPYRYPLLIAAALLLPARSALLATHDVDPVLPTRQARTNGFPFAIIALMGLVGFLRLTGEGIGRTFFNVYLDAGLHISTLQIGGMLAVAQLLAVPAALYTPVLVARWGNARVILWATLGSALSLLPIALIPHWIAVAVGFFALLALVSITRPAWIVYTQEAVVRPWWSAMSGATTMAVGLSWSAVAFAGGYVISTSGYTTLFVMGALLTAAGGLLFAIHILIVQRRTERACVPEPEERPAASASSE